MHHCKVDVQKTNLYKKIRILGHDKTARGSYELWICMNDLGDTLSSEGLLSESPLDIIQNFGLNRVIVV